jgi:hypothetical protein
MSKQQQKAKKIGRNDPCHCGSGRKYKDCHLPQEQAERSANLRLRQGLDSLMPKIIEAARSIPAELPAAFTRFWQGKYSFDQMEELEEHENRGSERFLIWFSFDYQLSDGRTLVEQLGAAAESGGFELDPYERQLIGPWGAVRSGAYKVVATHKGIGVTLRDLLTEAEYSVADYGASTRLAVDEVVVGHLLPADTAPGASAPTYYVGGAAAHLTADTAERLVEFAELHLADLRREQPEATWADLFRARSEILNHFVSALPVEKHDPTIMERIILEGRTSLQLTSEAVNQLLGRDKDPE